MKINPINTQLRARLTSLPGRYATALFLSCKDTEATKKAYEECLHLYRTHSSFRTFLKYPRSAVWTTTLRSVGEALNFPAEFICFLNTLSGYKHLNLLKDIYKNFQVILDQQNNCRRFDVEAAHLLTDIQLQTLTHTLQKLFQKETILLTQHQDLSLMGGFVVHDDYIRIDASVIYQWNRFKHDALSGES